MDKITVKDIVEECGINRNTFYYYFADIYDLIDGFYVQIHTIDGEDYMVHMARNTFGKVIGETNGMNSYIEDKMIGFTLYADYTTRNN